MWTELSNTILPQATEINGKRRLSISVSVPIHAKQLAHGQGIQNRAFPSKHSESVHAGQTGTGLLEGSQEMNLSSPHQYRPVQKALATPNHLVDLNIWLELVQFPGSCIATSSLAGVAVLGVRTRMENRWGGSKSAEQGACATTLHASNLLGEEALKRQRRLTPKALCSRTLEVPGFHIHSVLQPPSAQYYSLPLFQPGTWPARISAKRQWSLPL